MLSIKRLILAVFTVFFISWSGTAVAAVSEGDVSQCPEHSSWYSESSGLSAVATCKCDDGYTADGTINGSTSVAPGSTEPCKFAAEFTITTIEDMADKTFSFTINAAGSYTIDWGDGTAATTYTATTPGTITHTYAAAKTGGYTIGITGSATSYASSRAAINFDGNTNIAELGGSLGAIFGGTAQPYMFQSTFQNCTNLTTIPSTLFSGVTGATNGMFGNTFRGCTSLQSIPSGLFSGVDGAADGMFDATFRGCTSLQSIPSDLFSGVDGAADRMFYATFYGCTSLQSIPDTLFSGVTGAANYMFHNTFTNCSALSEIPDGLFSGVTGAADGMFNGTFNRCTKLTEIPDGLFSGVTGAADYMFGSTSDTSGTFAGCTSLTSIPVDLFANVTGEPGTDAFANLFNGATNITKFVDADGNVVSTYVPEQFFSGISGTNANAFTNAFKNTGLAEVCPDGTINANPYYATAIAPKVVCAVLPTITYNFSGGTGGNTDGYPVFFVAGETVVPENTSVKSGYKFSYWTCYADGSYCNNRFQNPGDVMDLGLTASELKAVKSIELRANWVTCPAGYMCPADSAPIECPANSTSTDGATSCTCNSGFTLTGTLGGATTTTGDTCRLMPEFTITTIEDMADKTFSFTINAAGSYTIDWGDGTAATTYTATTPGTITHTYAAAKTGGYTIGIAGDATAYNADNAAINFFGNTNIAELGGSLGAIFGGTAQPRMFYATFYGCTSLQSIPDTLFSGVTGAADEMFLGTFYGCTSLQSIPDTLFSGVTGAADSMFARTFARTGIEKIPSGLFANVTGEPGTNAFANLFEGATNITNFVDADGNEVSTYVPEQFFGGISGTNASAFTSAFANTQLAQTCPDGTINVNPYYADAIAPKVVCEPFTPEFTITTIDMAANTTFSFSISAAGNYTIDWGDGSSQKIEKTDTNVTTYTHTYAAAKTGGYTIGIAGDATAYNADNAAISFDGNTNIAELGGSLGAIFGGTAQPYMFQYTFKNCTNLTTIPETLFSGVTGAAERMFSQTFRGCTSLTEIPSTLFSGVTGAADGMFVGTFLGCTSLQSIPSGLFSGVTGAAENMFGETFAGCRSLQSIPSDLFSGVSGAANHMFFQTFYGCSALSEIPSGLFDGVNGAAIYMFHSTFANCTSLQSIPSGLFSGVDGAAVSMFGDPRGGTFSGCTSLTAIPVDLFANITGTPVTYAFSGIFKGASNITKFVDANGNTVSTYVPEQFFGNLTAPAEYNSNMFAEVFLGTGLAEVCPDGTININPYYADAIAPKVVCEPFTPEFTITTIEDMADKTFSFKIGAAGNYTIDWGDGNAQKIEKTGTITTTYTHTYATAKTGGYTIGIAGDATAYNARIAAISFGDNTYVAELGGSLGAIFGGPAQPYMFRYTFQNCTNLTTIPETLFSGISGAADSMFNGTFNNCTNLTEIPDGLFDGVTGAADSMFNGTFHSCTSLQSIPDGLFSGVSGSADKMFFGTFYGCTSLQSISSGLFGGVSGAANYMFSDTFNDCTSLQSIPSGLFSGVSGSAVRMFDSTFHGCTSLQSIPSGLFSGVTGAAGYMFGEMFYGCTSLQSIPSDLFSGVTGAAAGMFSSTFLGCTSLQSIPVDLFTNITEEPVTDAFADLFNGATNITNFVDANGNVVSTYVPTQFFGGMAGTNADAFTSAFEATQLAQTCPDGTININPYYADAIAPKVVCEPFTPEFTITTIEDMADKTFSFTISAAGNYTIDWGDGNGQKIEKTDTTVATYTHTYAAAKTGGYTIGMAGSTTAYNADNAAISFRNNTYVAELGGSLGAIFGGPAQPYMFLQTFYGCTSLQSIPDTLFSGISGAAADMFYSTFYGCTSLQSIPSGLFSGVTGAADRMFFSTFSDCTSLQSIPDTLFSGVDDAANQMFRSTFRGCTSLQSIPSGLFSGISGVADYMFSYTFNGCTSLQSIPVDLFANITDTPADRAFADTFANSVKITNFVDADGNAVSTYVPTQFFGGMSGTNAAAFTGAFASTGLAEVCPDGYVNANLYYADAIAPKVVCILDSEFTIKTIDMEPNTTFSFSISAAGNYTIDWGDGTAATTYTATTPGTITHTYANGGVYTIGMAGDATAYNATNAAISFNGNTNIAELGGSLGAIFGGTAQPYMFQDTFQGCTNLTTIPDTLFSGVTGAANYMFSNTFYGCTSLQSIPSDLFSGVDGAADYMFRSTFANCTSLQSIPSDLFSGVSGAANYMFSGTFHGCTSLQSIPSGLFSGVSGSADRMFDITFRGCTSLQSIPSDLFSGVTGAAGYMFHSTFSVCTSLQSIPVDLFANVKGEPGTGAFGNLFGSATNITKFVDADGNEISTYVPEQFFGGMGGTNATAFTAAFEGTGLAEVCPDGYVNANPYYADAIAPKVVCILDSEFTITTLNLAAQTTFSFDISAAGDFVVYWGDGQESVVSNPTAEKVSISHTYETGGVKTIGLAGQATEYSDFAAISFKNNFFVASVAGSLGAVFGTLSDGTVPLFTSTFAGCSNLKSISGNLFAGATGVRDMMFYETFKDCIQLETVPETLFSGVNGAANSLFRDTFNGCTSLQSVSENLFSGVSGAADYMFSGTFKASGLYEVVPSGLFRGVSGTANRMFAETFRDCKSLEYVPVDLFAGVSGDINNGIFDNTFKDSDIARINAATRVDYIPREFFANMTLSDANTINYMFDGTQLATVCPDGFVKDMALSEKVATKAVCYPIPDSEFSITTAELAAGTDFAFNVSAKGEYVIDWGDGVSQTINKTDTNVEKISHKYEYAGAYTIRMSGQATGYVSSGYSAAISFSDNTKIVAVDGSLGAIFGTLADGTAPRFVETFMGCSSLTSIPETLFSGVTGVMDNMFNNTFGGCTGLTEIPERLFAEITSSADFMFTYTFSECSGLTSIPENLFSGVTDAAEGMFYGTFSGCTGLTEIPAGLFSGVDGVAESMFGGTFGGCTGLTTVPAGLFSGVSGTADSLFLKTFMNCTGLTSVPVDLFANIVGTPAASMFNSTFDGATGLGGIKLTSDSVVDYIPRDFFGQMVIPDTNTFSNMFANTALATTCPTGTVAEETLSGYVSPKVVCDVDTAISSEFTITTTEMTAGTEFGFSISAAGEFVIDWGDGEIESVINNTPEYKYMSHTYENAGVYTIGIAGDATAYSTNEWDSSVSFGWNGNIAEVSGSLGAIFGTLGDGTSPRFAGTFSGCSNLKSVPATLFSGVVGATSNMFNYTFANSGLTAVPEDLFAGISGNAESLFNGTFSNCYDLETVPSGLFDGVSGAANYMFAYTFSGCPKLSSVPADLFDGVSGAAENMFGDTFSSTGLTSVPSGLFSGVVGAANSMFSYTFYGCEKLTTVPADLFGQVSGAANYMFNGTFSNSGLVSLPDGLFAGINGAAEGMFSYTFSNNSSLVEIPSGLFGSNMTGTAPYMFSGTFYSCNALTNIPVDLFANITGTVADYAFGSTFGYSSNLSGIKLTDGTVVNFIPVEFFEGMTIPNTNPFGYMFEGTQLATSCPSGFIPDEKLTEYLSPKAVCTALPAPEFTITTNNMAAGTTFNINITAAGEFIIDWGDGDVEVVSKLNPGYEAFSHTYKTEGVKTITMSGQATAYSTNEWDAAVSFGWNESVAEVSGKLGAIFGTLQNGQSPRFIDTFSGCTNLTSVPEMLFDGVTSATSQMFAYTFYGCSGLTTVPVGLFGGVTGAAPSMFQGTFSGCSNLSSVPEGLFDSVDTSDVDATGLFNYTFYNCGSLKSVPAGLFNGVSNVAEGMFNGTFSESGLESVSAGLFGNITGTANYLFAYTFSGCKGITSVPANLFDRVSVSSEGLFNGTFSASGLTSVPSALFDNFTTASDYMFSNTFSNCESLSEVPVDLFANITGEPGNYAFNSTFGYSSNLSGIKLTDGTAVNYIPVEFFESMTIPNTNVFYYMFNETGLATACPSGLFQDEKLTEYMSPKAVCATDFESEFTFYLQNGTANHEYAFELSAAGEYVIDWGDGSLPESIVKTETGVDNITHTYEKTGLYTVRMMGQATAYSEGDSYGVIGFGAEPDMLVGVEGALGAIFGTLADGTVPSFKDTFSGCTSLTSIPETLFSGVTGVTNNMFEATFYGCSRLTSIPDGLFSGVDGAAESMFSETFSGCSRLTSIPDGLFSGVTGAADRMFSSTFYACSRLQSIPDGLFSGVDGAADGMFFNTFGGCTSLQSIPSGLFSGVTGAADGMFSSTFDGCTSLTEIPENLFHGVTGAAEGMFNSTFYGCTGVTSIPENLFSGVNGVASSMFIGTFDSCTSLMSVPVNLFANVSGTPATGMFGRTFSGATNLANITLTDGTNVNYIPREFFGKMTIPTTNTFSNMFTNTALATTCPSGFAADAQLTEYVSPKAVCDVVPTSEFTITTKTVAAGGTMTFNFSISAAGNFTIDWGDGMIQPITKTNTTNTSYSYTYTNSGTEAKSYTIGIAGDATGYNTSTTVAAISFSSNTNIAAIDGSLGAIFGTLANGAAPRFYRTFYGCTGLTSIPETLFSGLETPTERMFNATFYGCTGLTEIPAGLFSDVKGAANYMFTQTFYNCNKLTSIPKELFSGVTGVANYTFSQTFQNCTGLTSVPVGLFASVSGTPGTGMFSQTFYSATKLTNVELTDGTNINYIPVDFFGQMTIPTTNTFPNMFYNTGLATTCPTGTVAEATLSRYVSPKVVCFNLSAQPEFTITTKTVAAGGTMTFSFNISAAGRFVVDWGDGTAQQIAKTNTTNTSYSHTYTNSGTDAMSYTIGIAGDATAYNATNAAISFSGNTNIAELGGSLGAIFGGTAQPNMFQYTFQGCTNLTAIPETLFSDISGAAASMFNGTFYGCTSLQSIPDTLFSGVSGAANSLFSGTFGGCTSLQSIPDGLFSGISGAADGMFGGTFGGCTSLQSIPSDLFSGVTGAAVEMFVQTFYGCSALSEIPDGLFSGVTGAAGYMFNSTFGNCTSLQSIPSDLFSGISGAADVMFGETFNGCTSLQSIPSDLFSGVTGAANEMFYATFNGCTSLQSIPSGLFSGISGAAGAMFGDTFNGCTSLQSIPVDLFANVKGEPGRHAFANLFNGATNLANITLTDGTNVNYIPREFFGKMTIPDTNTFSNMFANTALATTCPSGFESDAKLSGYVSPKVVCDVLLDFAITTVSGTTEFHFNISAAGEFTVMWGDGRTQKIVKPDTTDTMYSHTYDAAGEYKVQMSGNVTAYNENASIAAISFYSGDNFIKKAQNAQKIALVSGRLGAVFGTLDDGSQPRFVNTFMGGMNITKISANLFGGISGAPVDSMFYGTFGSCSSLTQIPATLFGSIVGNPAPNMFKSTFENCSGVTEIPAGLFAGISGVPAESMFEATFFGCSGATGVVPGGLFAGISGTPAASMFADTFNGCTGLTSISSGLFSAIEGPAAPRMFFGTFSECSSLTSIPENLFGNITGDAQAGMFMNTFKNCTSVTSPSARINGQYLYNIWPDATTEQVGGAYTNDKSVVDYVCIPTVWGGLGKTCGAPEFIVKTTDTTGNFVFNISAAGEFIIDWGDGSQIELITKDTAEYQDISHTYSVRGRQYEIKMQGDATEYHQWLGAVSFGYNENVAELSGSLGAIFGTLDDGTQPVFSSTFAGCSNLTKLPSTLFNGLTGTPAEWMFESTFANCVGLTEVPGGMFASFNGGAANNMFQGTFGGCSALTSVPEDLFSGIAFDGTADTSANGMFGYTFNASGLTSVPAGLFGGITAAANNMFNGTFSGCQDLTSLPNGLFAGVKGAGEYMYSYTFSDTGLIAVPSDLFDGVSGSAYGLFSGTFNNCVALQTIPENLFSNVVFAADSIFSYTFSGCSALQNIPENLFVNMKDVAPYMFAGTFDNCVALTTVPENLFAAFDVAADGMFANTFSNCTGITQIPANLFATFTGVPKSYAFGSMFYGSTNLATVRLADGRVVDYIPFDLFKTMTVPSDNVYYDMFTETKLATVCPQGTGTNQILTDYLNPKAVCYPKVLCEAGYYVPADTNECVICLGGGYCVGGEYDYGSDTNQGIEVCAENNYSDAGASVCSACATNKGYFNAGETFAEHFGVATCKTTCGAGQYVATAGEMCENVGEGYYGVGGDVSQGEVSDNRNKCADSLTTIGYGAGADEVADCGRILHVGENKLYLRSAKKNQDELALNVRLNMTNDNGESEERVFFGTMTTEEKFMSAGVDKALKINIGNTVYYVHDDSVM